MVLAMVAGAGIMLVGMFFGAVLVIAAREPHSEEIDIP